MSTVDLDFYFHSPDPDLSRIGAMLWLLFKGCFVCFEKQTLILLQCPCSMSIQKGRFSGGVWLLWLSVFHVLN